MGFWRPGAWSNGGFSRPSPTPINQLPGYLAVIDSRYGISLDGSNNVETITERYGNGCSWTQSDSAKRLSMVSNVLGTIAGIRGSQPSSVHYVGNTAARDIFRNLTGLTIYSIARQQTSAASVGCLYGVRTNSDSTDRLFYGTSVTDSSQGGVVRGADADAASAFNGPYGQLPNAFPRTTTIDYANDAVKEYRNNILCGQNLSATLTSPSANTTAAKATVFSNTAAANFWTGELLLLAFFSGAHTPQQQTQVWQSLQAEYPGLLRIANETPQVIVQMHGDSLTQGTALPNFTPTLPDRLWDVLSSSGSTAVLNIGRGGGTISTLSANAASLVDILPVSAASQDMVYVVYAGVNDIIAGTPGATTYSSIKTLFQGRATARPGIKIIVCTPIACAESGLSAGERTELVNLRNEILANAVADGATAVCDFGAMPQFLTASTTLPNNTTYYHADKLHLTDAGNKLLAAELANTINTIT